MAAAPERGARVTLDKQTRARAMTHGKPREATFPGAITLYVPVHTVSEMNVHQHWRRRHKRAQAQHEAVALKFAGMPLPALPAVVTFMRISGKTLDDDNLRSALKFVRDEVAAQYGIDDADPRITWRYTQADDVRARGIVRIDIRPIVAVRDISRPASQGRQLGRAK